MKELETIINYIKNKAVINVEEARQILPMLEKVNQELTPKENANKRTTKKSS